MKKIIKTIVILVIIIMPFSSVYAFSGTIGGISTSSENDKESGDTEPSYEVSDDTNLDSNGNGYLCEYSANVNSTETINVNAFDKDGNDLIRTNLNISSDKALLAGTAIKLNIYELKVITYNVTFNVTRIYETNSSDCIKYSSGYCYSNKGNKVCNNLNKSKEQCTILFGRLFNCSWNPPSCKEYKKEQVKEEITSGNEYEACKSKAISYALRTVNSYSAGDDYNISITNSNDTNSDDNFTNFEKESTSYKTESGCTNTSTTCVKSAKTYYTISNVCMNMVTGEVNYRSKNDSCSNYENEVKIEDKIYNGEKYFNYFIPLNAISGYDSFNVLLIKDHIYNKQICQNLINNASSYNDYVDFIVSNNGTKLTSSKENNLLLVKNGCKTHINFKVPVKQQFYLEKEDSNGNNIIYKSGLYFRKVNINNPFPNGISNSESLWNEWYSSKIKSPDFSKSFDTISYVADNSNLESVRKYNKLNGYHYSNWGKTMSKDGLSSLISSSSGGIAVRKTAYDGYELGMGPLLKNTNDVTKDDNVVGIYDKNTNSITLKK